VAQKSGLRVYRGHEMETIHFSEKQQMVAKGYQKNLPEEFIKNIPVKWVMYGPYEKTLAPDFKPGNDLVLVFSNSYVKVFQVK
jgi:hypothetical protein